MTFYKFNALYIGLVVALGVLVIRFWMELVDVILRLTHPKSTELLLAILEVVDITLVANLLLVIIFSGYENFVSKIGVAQKSEDRPSWMGSVDFSNLKLKVISSVVAISVIQLLQAFLEIDKVPKNDLMWMMGLHFLFVISGVLFALTDLMQKHTEKIEHELVSNHTESCAAGDNSTAHTQVPNKREIILREVRR